MRPSGSLPTGPAGERHAADQYPNTLCSWQAKCAFRTCLEEQVKSDNIVEHEDWCERLTIGRFCASQAPQLCLAAARINLRLAPPRRNTPHQVRFDVPCSHESSKFVVVSALSRIRTVSSSWSSCAVVSSGRFSFSPSLCPVTVKESEIVTSSCMWL